MSRVTRMCLVGLLSIGFSLAAAAWGAKTQRAIVSTAVHVLSYENDLALKSLNKDFVAGGSVSQEELNRMFPGYERAAIKTIENEMNLLGSVRGESLDGYLAYRLGLLGQLVARLTSPMEGESPAIRESYYRDVDRAVERVNYKGGKRKIVDPAAFFKMVVEEARFQTAVMLKDYQSGLGFGGVAGGALNADASRSINAVADVWYTVLSGGTSSGRVAAEHVREYVVGGMGYYAGRGNVNETNAAYARYQKLLSFTPEVREQIGDLYFEMGAYDRAIAEYNAVAEAQPQNRRVTEKIAEYYVKQGDTALDDEALEDALRSYTEASNVDKLNESAQRKKIEAEAMIGERDARMNKSREALQRADALRLESDRVAVRGNYSEAVMHLAEAQTLLDGISTEFVEIQQQAKAMTLQVRESVRQYKRDLVNNAQTLSGSAFELEVRRIAETTESESEQAIQDMISAEYRRHLRDVKDTIGREIH